MQGTMNTREYDGANENRQVLGLRSQIFLNLRMTTFILEREPLNEHLRYGLIARLSRQWNMRRQQNSATRTGASMIERPRQTLPTECVAAGGRDRLKQQTHA